MKRLILNEELPIDLRGALDARAKEMDITLNDVATSILSEHYQLDWKPSGFPYRPVAAQFKLRVEEDLHRMIRMEAAHKLQTIRGIALNILSVALGTRTIDPNRRPRREVA